MAETALGALYIAVHGRLTALPTELWAGRAFSDLAKAGTPRPYVIYSWAGGGELNHLVKQDAEIVLTIKGVSETQTEAFAIASRISVLFNDADLGKSGALAGGTDWVILSSTQELAVQLVEGVDSTWIYHAGHRFRFRLETP